MGTIKVYSVLPYVSKNSEDRGIVPTRRELYARECFYGFKNGRDSSLSETLEFTFEELLEYFVDFAKKCPAFFDPPSLVPVPRSGKSAKSFGRESSKFACLDFARALEAAGLGHTEDVITRKHPREPASSRESRPLLETEISAYKVELLPKSKYVVLIDDSITKGTTMAAAAQTLVQAGYEGEINGFTISQTVHPSGASEHREWFLTHSLYWDEGNGDVERKDESPWMAPQVV